MTIVLFFAPNVNSSTKKIGRGRVVYIKIYIFFLQPRRSIHNIRIRIYIYINAKYAEREIISNGNKNGGIHIYII